MQYVKHWQYTQCSTQYSITEPMNLCPNDNRPVQLVLDKDAIKQYFPNMLWFRPEQKSMRRFGALLPFDIDNEKQKDFVMTLGEA